MLTILKASVLLLVSYVTTLALSRPLGYSRLSETVERRGCGTEISLQELWEMEERLLSSRAAVWDLETRDNVATNLRERDGGKKKARVLKQVSFDVYWHVVYANETTEGGYVSDEQISDQMRVMNEDFKNTNISWTLKNITRIPNEDWFVNVWPGSAQEQEMKKTYHKGDSSVLNIFTAQFNSTTKSLGFASLPSTYLRQPLSDGLIIRHTTLPGGSQTNYSHGRTTVHELGHWLGLYHTFEGGCEGVGDNIADTAPEAHPSEGCPVGRKSCPGSQVEDPIHNFMDYSWDTCMTHFTPGQAERMHEVIWAFRTKRSPSTSVAPPDTDPTSVSRSAIPSNMVAQSNINAFSDESENQDERSQYDDGEQRAWQMDDDGNVRDWDQEDVRGWYEADESWYI